MYVFIVDTNILMSDPQFILDFSPFIQYRVIILKPVIEELDFLKSAEGEVGYQAREASRFLEHLIMNAPRVQDGWLLTDHCMLIIDEQTESRLSDKERRGNCDDRILALSELYVKHLSNSGSKVWLVTLDRNMRIRAEARGIPWLNPGGWFPLAPNTYISPMVTYGMAWKAQDVESARLPVSLPGLNGWIEIWPYYGYPSGLFSTLHVRLFELTDQLSSPRESASDILIISSEDKIRYKLQMSNLPYKVLYAQPNKYEIIYYKNYKLEVVIRRSEVSKVDVFKPKYVPVVYTPSQLLIAEISSSIAKSVAEARAAPVIAKLSMLIRVSEATQEEIEKARDEAQAFKDFENRKKISDIPLFLILFFGVVIALFICAFMFVLLSLV